MPESGPPDRSPWMPATLRIVQIVQTVQTVQIVLPLWLPLLASLLVLACGGEAFVPPPDSLTVRVVGQNYGWQVRFAGPDGRFDTADDSVAGPDFHLPAGIPTHLEVTSQDYLYLLKIPEFAVKVMAVPDMVMTADLRVDQPATGALRGDPMCGFRHEDLAGRVTVVPWEEFARWRGSL